MELGRKRFAKCVVPGCMDFFSKRHTFPKNNPSLFKKWINQVQNPKLDNKTLEDIYKSYRVCDVHFNEHDRVPGTLRGLNKNAFPTEFLTEVIVKPDNESVKLEVGEVEAITVPDPLNKGKHLLKRLLVNQRVAESRSQQLLEESALDFEKDPLKFAAKDAAAPSTSQQIFVEDNLIQGKMGGAYCCVKDCYFSKSSKHRFPNPSKDPERFKKWLMLCGNKELLIKPAERVFSHNRVCGKHFVPSDFGPNNVLLKTAIPSVDIPDINTQIMNESVAESREPKRTQLVTPDTSKTAVQSNTQLTDPLADIDLALSPDVESPDFYTMELTDPLSDVDSPSTTAQNTTADVVEIKEIEEPAMRCRVCWEEKSQELLISVTKIWTREYPKTIKDIILICVPTMSIQDNSYICTNCHRQLKDAHKFVERCLKTETLLFQQATKGSKKLENILEKSIEKGNKIQIIFQNPQTTDEMNKQEIEIHPNPLDDYDDNNRDEIVDCDSKDNPSQISVSPKTIPQELVDLLDFAPFNVRTITINKEMSEEHRRGLLQEGINIVDMSEKSKKKRIIYLTRDIWLCSLKCNRCNLQFRTRIEYADHMHLHKKGKIKVSGEPAFTCAICRGEFTCEQDYRLHCLRFHNVTRPFQCKKCSKKFTNFKDFKRHEAEFGGAESQYCILTCKKCNKRFHSQKQLKSHEADVADAPCCDYSQCKICSEKFTKEDFREHCEVHPNFTCSDCGKSLSSLTALHTHEKNVHQAKPGMCHECGKIIKSPRMLRHHIEVVHGDNIFMCDKCPRQYKSKMYLWKHQRDKHITDKKVKRFFCEKCGKMFNTHDGLRQHLSLVHLAQVRFKCPKCGDGFTRKDYLQRHVAFHEKYAQFSCSVCNKSFMSESLLFTHQEIGHDENGKPFAKNRKFKQLNLNKKKYVYPCVCHICHKVLSGQASLKLHYKTHLKIREFVCQKCEITLQTYGAYKNHLKKHEDPDFDLRCNICHIQQSSQAELEAHKKQVHKNMKYQCKYCPAKFGRKHLMFSHESIKHSEVNAKKEKLFRLLACQPTVAAPENWISLKRKGVKRGAYLEDVDQVLDQLANKNEDLRDYIEGDPIEDILSEEYEIREETVACESIMNYMEQ